MTEEINSYETIIKAQKGDRDALNDIVTNNIALVKSIVGKFLNRGVEYEDLVQIGSVGLVRAIQKFDTSFDVKFSTYAVPMIMGEIKRYLRDNGTVKVSRSLKETAYKAMRADEAIKLRLGRDATIEEIAKETGLDKDDIIMAMDSVKAPVSLDEAMYGDDNKTTVLESLVDGKENVEGVIDKIMLKQMLSVLPSRDRQIIVMRYFYDKTQSEVAGALNISQVQVSRLESKILKIMKEKIS